MLNDEIRALAAALRAPEFIVREAAAQRLAAAGVGGARALSDVAIDAAADTAVRVTAARHLPAGPEVVETLRVLLRDPAPVVRVVALARTAAAHAKSLAPLVEDLVHDPARFWDLDEEVVVAEVAARTLAALSASSE